MPDARRGLAEYIYDAFAAADIDPLAAGIERGVIGIRAGRIASQDFAGAAVEQHEARRRAEDGRELCAGDIDRQGKVLCQALHLPFFIAYYL